MTLRRRVNQFYTKVWTIRVACELSFQRRVCFSEGCKHSRNSEKNTASRGVVLLRSENSKRYIDPPALQRSAISIANGILTLPHSSGVLCVLKRYAVSLRKILKIVQSLVIIGFTIIKRECDIKA